MNTQASPAFAVRADLHFRPKVIHTFFEMSFTGMFFLDKLAIDQVLPYHNSALRTMHLLRLGHDPVGAW